MDFSLSDTIKSATDFVAGTAQKIFSSVSSAVTGASVASAMPDLPPHLLDAVQRMNFDKPKDGLFSAEILNQIPKGGALVDNAGTILPEIFVEDLAKAFNRDRNGLGIGVSENTLRDIFKDGAFDSREALVSLSELGRTMNHDVVFSNEMRGKVTKLAADNGLKDPAVVDGLLRFESGIRPLMPFIKSGIAGLQQKELEYTRVAPLSSYMAHSFNSKPDLLTVVNAKYKLNLTRDQLIDGISQGLSNNAFVGADKKFDPAHKREILGQIVDGKMPQADVLKLISSAPLPGYEEGLSDKSFDEATSLLKYNGALKGVSADQSQKMIFNVANFDTLAMSAIKPSMVLPRYNPDSTFPFKPVM